MQNDTAPIDIVTRILPDLEAIDATTRDNWAPALRDTKLRTDIFACAPLAGWVRNTLVANSDFSPPDAVNTDVTINDVVTLLDTDPESVITKAGLVWHANQLARLVSAGTLSLAQTGWDINDVRFALGHRSRSKAPDVTEQTFPDLVIKSGEACLSAFLHRTPADVQKALNLAASPLGRAFRQGHHSVDKAAVLSLCLHHIGDTP